MAETADPEGRVIEEAVSFTDDLLDGLSGDLLRRSGGGDAEVKRDGTFVSAADVDANERIVAAIEARFPEHGVVSEELRTVYDGEEWCWIVDPIDGTTNYVRGLPTWCVSIALAFRGTPVLGVVDAPALGRRYRGVRGAGATRDGAPMSVHDADWDVPGDVRNALLGLSSGMGRYYTVRTPLKPRVLGSAALHLAMVAEGSLAAGALAGTKVWDVAAGTLLVEEAGGVLIDIDGAPAFPMVPGTDQAELRHRFIASASERTAREVMDAFRVVETW